MWIKLSRVQLFCCRVLEYASPLWHTSFRLTADQTKSLDGLARSLSVAAHYTESYRQLCTAWVGNPGRETSCTVIEIVPTNNEQYK